MLFKVERTIEIGDEIAWRERHKAGEKSKGTRTNRDIYVKYLLIFHQMNNTFKIIEWAPLYDLKSAIHLCV